ncbi:MAG: aldehyde dehydrogenase family protein, partial [Chloroflexi bacterium]|nr:aldehyde dehydrogenase family protein [Chloroflexota bacterium]
KKVSLAQKAWPEWYEFGIDGRNRLLRKLYSIFEKNAEGLAALQAKEMGMPIKEAKEDVEFGIDYLKWYSNNAFKYLSPEITYEDKKEVHTVYREPVGVVVVIVPWNFPMSNFVWQCGQNLVAGNTIVFKHSEEVVLFGKKLEELFDQSALPKGVFNIVHGDGKVGDILVHQNIQMICFTGSTKTGKYLYKVAAEKFIPARMELGGSSPGIIFRDADIENIIDTALLNRFMNCGQICDGLKRLIVHESIYEKTLDVLSKRLKSLKIGDALNEDTELGPLVAERQVKLLEKQVAEARKKGAKVLLGGKRPSGLDGAYFEPTLITNVTGNMRIWTEEVFGPVLPVVSFKTEEEAIRLANDTKYGLGAYVFTKNKKLFNSVAKRLESGMVSLNNVSYVRECNPFGGYKDSGLGREQEPTPVAPTAFGCA